MKIEEENYTLDYNEDNHSIQLKGSLRLNGLNEYAPVLDVLTQCLNKNQSMSLDLSELVFLNSSGIAMLSKFVIAARGVAKEHSDFKIVIFGAVSIPWQGKSLKNLQRLFPALEVSLS